MRADASRPARPERCAQAAGLHYVTDAEPGIRRVRRGDDFAYLDADGRTLRDPEVLARIRSLAIPPAYTDVWICLSGDGHLQATGRDAKGRKQYRYHPRWREVRDGTKFHRLAAFARSLPALRAAVEHHLALPGLPREKVLAVIVRLLETTLIRIGNEEYARGNDSYGLTTLHDEHVQLTGAQMRFHFRGKSGKEHSIAVQDPRLARIVRRCREIPGHELFQYVDDAGRRHAVHSGDVNAYLREACGHDFTAKDFRTWAGTLCCAVALRDLPPFATAVEAKRNVAEAVKIVAGRLGNTPAVCRKCYIHPAVVDAYLEGSLAERMARAAGRARPADPHALSADEAAVASLVRDDGLAACG